jgi:ketol-acid reductoisomerase
VNPSRDIDVTMIAEAPGHRVRERTSKEAGRLR